MRKAQLEQLTDFELQKKTLIEERKWLESVREEVDHKMMSSNKTQPRVQHRLLTTERNTCDLPRQMPSEIDKQLKEQ